MRKERAVERAILAGTLLLSSCAAKISAGKTQLVATENSDKRSTLVSPTHATFTATPTLEVTPTLEATPTALPDLRPPVMSLESFIDEVKDGSDNVTGVYAPGLFALPVLQQPVNDDTFVSAFGGDLTQFRLPARRFGTLAFMAHNFSFAGFDISSMEIGQGVYVINGKGAIKSFEIEKFVQVRVIHSLNPGSDVIDINTGKQYSADEFFNRVYRSNGGQQIVFETCISNMGDPAWGRLFVIGK